MQSDPSFLFLKEVSMEQNNMKCTGNIGAKQCGRLMRYSMQLIMLPKIIALQVVERKESISLLKKG